MAPNTQYRYVDGHVHADRFRIEIDEGDYYGRTPSMKKGALLHEIGHVLGLGHLGPQMGITNSVGFLLEKPWDDHPSEAEREQLRSHVLPAPEASAPEFACVGWPRPHVIQVGYWDTAVDDVRNVAIVRRNGATVPGFPYKGGQNGGEYRIGHRVTWSEFVPNVPGGWQLEARVEGGPDGGGAAGSAVAYSDVTKAAGVDPPCLVRAKAVALNTIGVSWLDSWYAESYYQVYRARLFEGGNTPIIQFMSVVPAFEGPGRVYWQDNNVPGDGIYCYLVDAIGPGGAIYRSKASCAPNNPDTAGAGVGDP